MRTDAHELLRRWRDGVLEPGESVRLQRILADGPRARVLVEELRLEQAIRETLLTGSAGLRQERKRRRLVLVGGVIAAAAAVLIVGLLLVPVSSGPAWRLDEGRLVLADASHEAGAVVPSGSGFVAGPEGARLQDGVGGTLELSGGAQASIDAEGIHLNAGAVACRIAPGSHGGFAVTTPHLTARVRGTRFLVQTDAEAATVSVSEGAVQVSRAVDGAHVELAAGTGVTVREDAPMTLHGGGAGADWGDRRPIALLRLWGGAEGSTPATNPRTYRHAPPGADLTTPDGRAAFASALRTVGEGYAARVKAAGGQGVLVWDLEGNQPGGIMYAGDPARLADLAPEMDAAADALFAGLSSQGLRTGVLLRPERLERDAAGGWRQTAAVDHAAHLAAKARYANRRWGCSLFFVNSDRLPGRALAAGAVAAIADAVPDARIIVEHPGPADWSAAAGWALAPAPPLPAWLLTAHPRLVRVVYQAEAGPPTAIDPRSEVLVREIDAF